jgi:hypothetical protein
MLLAGILALSGCSPVPKLDITPAAATFGTDRDEVALVVHNGGATSAHWVLEEVVRENVDAPWVVQEVPWLSADKLQADIASSAIDRVLLTADRGSLGAGEYTNTGVRFSSGEFEQFVPVSITVQATLEVTPPRISLRPGTLNTQFNVLNKGNGPLNWTVTYIPAGGTADQAQPLPADMTVTPNPGSTQSGESTRVTVVWAEAREDFQLLVDSPGGQGIVQVTFGAALPGLEVVPESLTLYYDPKAADGLATGAVQPTQPASTLTITNIGAQSRNWTIEINNLTDPGTAPSISATPNQAGTLPGEAAEVAVRVTDVTKVLAGSGNYELIVRSGDGFLAIPLFLEKVSLPVVAASDVPAPNNSRPEVSFLTTLDFGRNDVQTTFWVCNVGPTESRLNFKIKDDDQSAASPVIVSVDPRVGELSGPGDMIYIPNTNTMIDAVAVTVVVDRTAMVEDVEYRDIVIEAWDQDYKAPITAVEPVTIKVRVERPPLGVEGAINRARPPYLQRFVFLLRDTSGRAIPVQTAAERANLNFTISEEGREVDFNEVTLNVGGSGSGDLVDSLKTNMVLMLDFTGSLYNAGGNDASSPLAPGVVIEQVRSAAMRFIDDLPFGYRLALMYHNDRQQSNRLIHPFTTDRAALKNALAAFSVPADLHGTSAVWDSVADAVNRLVGEDPPEVLPFDDADVRAVVFLTDGQDNSSKETADSVSKFAKDNRVRLYPVGYAPKSSVDTGALLTVAADTGGHFYGAGDPTNLAKLLGNEFGLVLDPADNPATDKLAFDVTNTGTATLNWTIVPDGTVPWITSVAPNAGSTAPGARTRIIVTVNPAAAGAPPLHQVGGVLLVHSDNGEGAAAVYMALDNANAVITRLSATLYDEPGRILSDLRNQLVLSYVTPSENGGKYAIRVNYTQPNGKVITGFFEEDGLFYRGDVRAGQLSMITSGIIADITAPTLDEAVRAEVYLRADYVPRGVNRFRVRLLPAMGPEVPESAAAAFANVKMSVELAPNGLLVSSDPFASSWRLVPEQDNIYTLLTDQQNTLGYGSSGTLLRIRFTALYDYYLACLAGGADPVIALDMRTDNDIYLSPATPSGPSRTVFFLYPSGPSCLDRPLLISEASDTSPAARTIFDLAFPGIDPEAAGAWDHDGDGLPDFQDPFPDDKTRPGLLTVPASINLSSGAATVTLRNNRLDTFAWTAGVVAIPSSVGSLDGRVAIDLTGALAQLAPGAQTTIGLNLNAAGLATGDYEANLLLNTDVFGTERTPITASIR